ncbi:MAG: GMC family oxidoreductase N-terminal domain-containing protein [Desulfovibrionaceae bacterium]|nr:GMC family oxidoreductase N-terminal domain-containing protein [Desulfovibrionaceae bacterium]
MPYDYVIVGGGSGGCALAGRLARRDPGAAIALIEAGPATTARSPRVNIPLGIGALVPFGGAYNYGYLTAPQPALAGRRGYQPRGRGVGGSSAINAMIYTRGHPLDYDDWARLGCTGWAWADVLPYFVRAENNERGASAWHGADGPLAVSDLRFRNPFSIRFVQAAIEAGFSANDDFNGPRQEGVGFYQVTQRNGRRCSAARAYLSEPPPNLHLITSAQVLRVTFDGARASGVELTRGGQGAPEKIEARAEVILAAGAFGTPQLLMCSGIGPAAALAALGIAVRQDAPEVGRNLADHIDFTFNKRVSSADPIGWTPRGLARLTAAIAPYRRSGRGLLTSNVAEAGGFIKTGPAQDRPDLQLHFCAALVDAHGRHWHWAHGYALHVCVLRPESRGAVTLAGSDARVPPVIDPRFLSAPRDLERLLQGARLARRILDAPALAEAGGRELYTSPEQTDAQLRQAIAEHADTIYHPMGTCRMGSDAGAVVDPQLRVRGIAKLRVADASVIPAPIGGNTNAPAIMIGERAADFLAGE